MNIALQNGGNFDYWEIERTRPKGFPGGAVVKNPSVNAGDTRDAGLISGLRGSNGRKEEEMATHSSVLAWRIPGTGESVRLIVCGVA